MEGSGNNAKIINCINTGDINSSNVAGGIFGQAYAPSNGQTQNVYIYNSCNKGTIKASNLAGGIVGSLNGDNSGYTNGCIYNCYNIGKVNTVNCIYQGGIYGQFRSMIEAKLEIKNSFILKELNIKVGKSGWSCLVNGENIGDDYSNATMLEKSYMESSEFVDKLNSLGADIKIYEE